MKICVLICGHATDYTQERYGDYGSIIVQFLGPTRANWHFQIAFDADYDLEGFDALVLTGSAATAHEEVDWILRLKEKIRHWYRSQRPMVGICFGHQVIAGALGGISEINPKGWEIGNVKVQASSPLPQELQLFQIHRDHVRHLPEGFQVLARSGQTDIQAYWAPGVLGIQGHPEFAADVIVDLIQKRLAAGILNQEQAESALQSLNVPQDVDVWQQTIWRMLETGRL
ncbi:MAG: type 1 glutamine amidotransferase [Acidobacteria bacterium]|nr:type 1 glutamine amidotransferase [Acidobacteriota bacterium]